MKTKKTLYSLFFKRLFDFLISLILIVLLLPLLLVLWILVRSKLGSPVIFKQERPGKNEKIFTIYKFRTMTNYKDEEGNLLPDIQRLTKFGRFLRSTSLDELPELFNILFGHMSIIGPRPLLVKYLPLYSEEQRFRHKVRPGLTGLAQVNGRNALTWEEKFKFDNNYVKKVTVWLDFKIIVVSVFKVLKREGISHDGEASMEEFKGTLQQPF